MSRRGGIRAVEDDEKGIGHSELVRMVLFIKRDYVPKGEFRMLIAGLTLAASGLITLLVTAINIRSGR